MKAPWYQRLDDDRYIDAIEVETVPRFKESEISGDEWRTSVVVRYKRNGVVVGEESYGDITAAVAHMARHATGFAPVDFSRLTSKQTRRLTSKQTHRLDEDYCFQPGCSEPWTVEYEKVREGCSQCGNVGETSQYHEIRVRFCETHETRGDASHDDADRNYRKIGEDTE